MNLDDLKNAVYQRLNLKGAANDKEAAYWTLASATPIIIAQNATPVSVTNTTTEAILASINIPSGILGINGSIRVTAVFSHTNSANLKNLNIRFGNTTFFGYGPVATTGTVITCSIRNRGAVNSQVSIPNTISGLGTTTGVIFTGAVDTSVDQLLTIRGTPTNVADSITLEAYTVEVLPAV